MLPRQHYIITTRHVDEDGQIQYHTAQGVIDPSPDDTEQELFNHVVMGTAIDLGTEEFAVVFYSINDLVPRGA